MMGTIPFCHPTNININRQTKTYVIAFIIQAYISNSLRQDPCPIQTFYIFAVLYSFQRYLFGYFNIIIYRGYLFGDFNIISMTLFIPRMNDESAYHLWRFSLLVIFQFSIKHFLLSFSPNPKHFYLSPTLFFSIWPSLIAARFLLALQSVYSFP